LNRDGLKKEQRRVSAPVHNLDASEVWDPDRQDAMYLVSTFLLQRHGLVTARAKRRVKLGKLRREEIGINVVAEFNRKAVIGDSYRI